MKWREFRAFLNTKFEDDQYISLRVDYNTGDVIIQKDLNDLGNNNAFILVDNTYIPGCSSIKPIYGCDKTNNTDPRKTLYYENEISAYFRGFRKE